MKGNNYFDFNGDTMVEAMQMYLNSFMDPAPRVTTVIHSPESGSLFRVYTTVDEDPKSKS